MRALPAGLTAKPTGMRALPVGLRAKPAGTGALPAGLTAKPTGIGALPVGMGALPTGKRALCVPVPLFAVLAMVMPTRGGAAPQGTTVTGVVVDEAGQPIAGAAVWAMRLHGDGAAAPSPYPGEPPAVSGPDGRFAVRGLDGEFRLKICAPGFQYGYLKEEDSIQAEPHRIVLRSAARLSGRITDPAGKPVAKASIFALRAGRSANDLLYPFDPCPGWSQQGETTSGPDGRFTV